MNLKHQQDASLVWWHAFEIPAVWEVEGGRSGTQGHRGVGRGWIVQSVKFLSYKHKGLSLLPRTHIKNAGMVACT